MYLTDYEQQMLEGKFGEGVAEAMKIQVAIGEAFGAECMVEISRAHEAFAGYESCRWFLKMLADKGARCRVPTTCNPIYDFEYLESVGIPVPEEDKMTVREAIELRKRLGIIQTDSCTPYLQDNIPSFGEVVGFSESSATPYVNSVCGGRTHRESANSALASGITGRVPLYGLLLDDNRKGNLLVKVVANLRDDYDYHLLGYTVGKEAGTGIPAFTGIPSRRPSPAELTSLGCQLATSGAVGMYHIVGFTPEAPNLETAFGGKPPEKEITISDADLQNTQEVLSSASGKIDFVMFGCPHYDITQVQDVARLLEGKTIKNGVQLWVLTSFSTKELARRMGSLDIIKKAGGHIIANTCSDMMCWERLYKGKMGMTDSPKAYYYNLHRGVNFMLRRRSECIEAALKGGC